MLPAVFAVAAAVGGTAMGIRSLHTGIETGKFWKQYYENTGYKPRYPVRSGVYDTAYAAFGVTGEFGKIGMASYGSYQYLKADAKRV